MTMRFHFGLSRSRTFAAFQLAGLRGRLQCVGLSGCEFLLCFGFFINVSECGSHSARCGFIENGSPSSLLRTPPDELREASVLHFQKALSINPLFTKAPWPKPGCHQHFSICGILVST